MRTRAGVFARTVAPAKMFGDAQRKGFVGRSAPIIGFGVRQGRLSPVIRLHARYPQEDGEAP